MHPTLAAFEGPLIIRLGSFPDQQNRAATTTAAMPDSGKLPESGRICQNLASGTPEALPLFARLTESTDYRMRRSAESMPNVLRFTEWVAYQTKFRASLNQR